MYLADFDYKLTYIQGEDNTAADALSRMPDAPPNSMLAACALAHTRSPSRPRELAAATLDITTDESLLRDITAGYQEDEFAQQLRKTYRLVALKGPKTRMVFYMWDRDCSFPIYPEFENYFITWPMTHLAISGLIRAMKHYEILITGQICDEI